MSTQDDCSYKSKIFIAFNMDQDDRDTLALILVLRRRRQQQRQRIHWVHPIHRLHRTHGEFHHLVQELGLDNYQFQRYFRLSVEQFDDLLSRVGPGITRQDTVMREAIGPAERSHTFFWVKVFLFMHGILWHTAAWYASLFSIAFCIRIMYYTGHCM